MKKHIKAVSAFLVIVLIFSFSSCADKADDNITSAQAVNSETSKITESTKPEGNNYVSAYKEYLTDYIKNTDNVSDNKPCFSLHYLDSDDIPELFISQGIDRISRVIIVSFDGEKTKELGKLGYFGVIGFEEKTGTVIRTDTSKSQIISTVYKLENGKFEEHWRGDHFLGGNFDEDTEEYYVSNGKTVEKTEYDRDFRDNVPAVILTNRYNIKSRAFPSVRFEVDGEEYEINTENIEKYIK